MIVFGNLVVLLAVLIDRDLRRLATNKFIASLAISDLLVGIVVMPLSLYATVNEIHWGLGDHWCQFHLVTGVFSTTASIIHLTAISLDRYFAIMFPTEYQRHSIATSTFPYIIMIWLVSFAVSSTLFMEKSLDQDGFCWIENPQYLVLSSLLSFFIPGAIVIYLYVKIFRKLRSHRLYIFGQLDLLKRQQNNFSGRKNDKAQCLPRAIGRRDSQLNQIGSTTNSNDRTRNGFLGQKLEVSSDSPKSHPIGVERRWCSPSVCVETLKHVRTVTSKKLTSITSDPQSMELSAMSLNYQPVDNQSLLLDHLSLNSANEEVLLKPFVASVAQSDSAQLPVVSVSFDDSKALDDAKDSEGSLITPESPMLLTLPKPIDNFSPTSIPSTTTAVSLQVPKWDCCMTPSLAPRSNSSRSTCTSTSGSDDTSRRISLHSFDTSITEDGTDSTAEAPNSRKVSTWSMLRTIVMTPNTTSLTKDPVTNNVPDSTPKATASRGRLRRIATQVTRAIRRKRRESLAIRRETRATGVVAAILIAFVICWIPYFCITVYRGVCTGLNIELNKHLHVNLFTVSSWLGYAHSCFNPIIYTCLNKNFRRTIKQMICCSCPKNRKSL
uniref:G-protein coupled receptors family 1 profile domain-containing protein n=1 Tax=Setaria digitata TaxID=48799 RepID=A0A915PNA0_9BILA